MKTKTEKLVKPLKKIKAQEKQNEIESQMVKPAVRIQELKNKLIILGHDLKVNKKINDSLYRKIQLLTYSRTTEQKLKDSYTKLKDIQKDIKKAEQLQGPTKIKKVTLKDFKKETKKEVLNNNIKFVIKPYEIAFPHYIFKRVPTSEQLLGWPGHVDGYCHVERRRSWTGIKLMRQRAGGRALQNHPRGPSIPRNLSARTGICSALGTRWPPR